MSNIKHSKGDPNWITPGAGQKVDYVHRIRMCLGGEIDLDPYSSDRANQVVGAKRYYTEKDDGHAQPWKSNAILCNHPGGHTVRAWKKLCEEYHARRANGIIWVGFSVEQLNQLADPATKDGVIISNETRWSLAKYYPLDFSVLITRKRIDFLKEATLQRGGRPSHGNYLVGIGVSHAEFAHWFGDLGYIHKGPLSVE